MKSKIIAIIVGLSSFSCANANRPWKADKAIFKLPYILEVHTSPLEQKNN